MSPTETPLALPARTPLPRNVRVLGLVSLVNDIASEMIFPLLPTFLMSVLGATTVSLGVIEGAADSAASLLKLWSGGRSDRAGRRKGFVIFGYALAAVTRPLIGLVTGPGQLFAIRLADRAGKGVRTSPRDALIADSTDPHNRGRAFGFHRAMDHLGAALGPALAALFLVFFPGQFRTLFLLTLAPGLAVLALVVFGLRETPAAGPAKQPVRLSLAPFGRDFRLFLVALAVFTLGNSSDAFLLVRAGELGVPTVQLPLLWGGFHVAKSLGNLFLGRAVDRVRPRPFLFAGWLLYALVYLAFGLATTAVHAWLLFLAYAVFYGMTEPAEKTLAAELAGAEHRGLAFGWFNFAIGIATFPASLVFGTLYKAWGALAAFGWGAALALAAVVLLAAVRPAAPRDRPGTMAV